MKITSFTFKKNASPHGSANNEWSIKGQIASIKLWNLYGYDVSMTLLSEQGVYFNGLVDSGSNCLFNILDLGSTNGMQSHEALSFLKMHQSDNPEISQFLKVAEQQILEQQTDKAEIPTEEIPCVLSGKFISLTGNVKIQGDVQEGAIVVVAGSLTIEGTVHNNASLIVKCPIDSDPNPPKRGKTDSSPSTFCYKGIAPVHMAHGSHVTVADVEAGKVEINDRIFTSYGVVRTFGNERYEISAIRPDYPAPSQKYVSATIDGREYEGRSILVQGKKITVDGKLQVASSAILCIKGPVKNGVKINSEVVIRAEDIGSNCNIEGDATFSAANVGANTTIKASNIYVQYLGSQCNLLTLGRVKAENVATDVQIKAKRDVILLNVGNNSNIDALGSLQVESVGEHGKLFAQEKVTIKENIGAYCTITSKGTVTAKNLSSNVRIAADESINVENVGGNSQIVSLKESVFTHDVGEGVSIQAEQAIIITGVCPRPETLTLISKTNNVKGPKSLAPTKVASASSMQQPSANSQSPVFFSQPVPDSEHLTTNSSGSNIFNIEQINQIGTSIVIERPREPKKAQKPSAAAACASATALENQSYVTGDYEGDLQRAIQASLGGQASKGGMFAATTSKLVEQTTEYPKEFDCPITCVIMDDPVVCALDGYSYSREAISESLRRYRRSPLNNIEMKPNQTIEDILTPNRALASMIENYQRNRVSNTQNTMG